MSTAIAAPTVSEVLNHLLDTNTLELSGRPGG